MTIQSCHRLNTTTHKQKQTINWLTTAFPHVFPPLHGKEALVLEETWRNLLYSQTLCERLRKHPKSKWLVVVVLHIMSVLDAMMHHWPNQTICFLTEVNPIVHKEVHPEYSVWVHYASNKRAYYARVRGHLSRAFHLSKWNPAKGVTTCYNLELATNRYRFICPPKMQQCWGDNISWRCCLRKFRMFWIAAQLFSSD